MQFIVYQLKNKPLRFSFILHLILFAIVYALAKPYFQSNDDVGMMLLAAGKILAVEPSPYLQFMHVFVGDFLSLLYTYFPNGYWYGLLFISCLFISYWAICYTIIKRTSHHLYALAIYLLYFAVLGYYVLVSLQFTMVASMVAIGGLVLLFFIPYSENMYHVKEAVFKKPKPYQIVSAGFIILASFIRFESMLFISLLFSPIIFYYLYQKQERFNTIHRLMVLIISLLACFILQKYHTYRYNSWSNFLEFNAKRAMFVDYGILAYAPKEAQIKALQSANWTVNDYYMLMNWFFAEESLYNVENFDKAIKELPAYKYSIRLDELIENQIRIYTYFRVTLASFIFFLGLCFCKKQDIILCITIFVFLFVALIGVHYFLKAPPLRVFLPAFCFIAILPMMFLHLTWNNLISHYVRLTGILIAFLVIILKTYYVSELDEPINETAKNREKNLKQLVNILSSNLGQETILVAWRESFPYELILPFSDLSAFARKLRIIGLGTSQQTPDTKKVMQRFGINNIYIDLIRKDNIFLVANSQLVALYCQYMKEHYNLDVVGDFIIANTSGLGIFKIREVKNSLETKLK